MAKKILLKRGLRVNLPILLEGELAYTKDTKELFVGTVGGNLRLLTENDASSEERTVVFVVSGELTEGVRDPHIVLPYDAEVLEIKAYVTNKPSMDVQLQVEASADYSAYHSLTVSPVKINANSYVDNGGHVLSTTSLSAETMLRINVVTGSVEARNLTVNIKINRK